MDKGVQKIYELFEKYYPGDSFKIEKDKDRTTEKPKRQKEKSNEALQMLLKKPFTEKKEKN